MRHVGLLVLGSFINSLGTGLTAFGLAVIMLRAHGTASSVAVIQMSAFAPLVLLDGGEEGELHQGHGDDYPGENLDNIEYLGGAGLVCHVRLLR